MKFLAFAYTHTPCWRKHVFDCTQVSERNDSNFFAIVGAFVLGPALIILALAYATGYLDDLARNQFF